MKVFLIVILFFVSVNSLNAQTNNKKHYLVQYGQVWGVLKYFHPKPSSMNWDEVLLKDFDKVQKCQSKDTFNILISSLINRCGDYTLKHRKVDSSSFFFQSFEFLDKNDFSIENLNYLKKLVQNKPKFKNKFILESIGVGNPEVVHEEDYGAYQFNPAIQYLALTRYWNVINYYYPNRDLLSKNWINVYENYLPIFLQANDFTSYFIAIRSITCELKDGHGFVVTKNIPIKEKKYFPFFTTYLKEGFFVTGIWQDSLNPFNLKINDRLVAISGVSIEEKANQLNVVIPASNEYYLFKKAPMYFLEAEDSLLITIERDQKTFDLKLGSIDNASVKKRSKPMPVLEEKPPYCFRKDSISGVNYCYINMGKLERKDLTDDFKKQLYDTKYVIIDSRNYPNWTVIALSKILIRERHKFARFKKINFDYPGSFEWDNSQTIGGRSKGYDGKIIVLVDYNTMSQAEYTVMALQQHPSTYVIGGQTAGADGNISFVPFPFDVKSYFSGLSVFYPDGTATQQIGIKRDLMVEQDFKSLLENKDLIFEKALEIMRAGK